MEHPPPIRCKCGKVLPHQRFKDLTTKHEPESAFRMMGIERLCCRVCLTTAKTTRMKPQETPGFMTLIPRNENPTVFRAR